jgi:lipopolysaccharide/colanic/teichoic acid biosynthesis glycosyltransferase
VAYVDKTSPHAVAHKRNESKALLRAHAGAWPLAKRVTDVVLATLMLVALIPVLLLVALAIKLDSRGPVLFKQRRYGRELKDFSVLKFRTMTHGASDAIHRAYIAELMSENGGGTDDDGGLKKLTADPRVTRVGAFLRKTSLDELPQLFNVVAGQMSLVGPRPALDYELEHYDPSHYARFAVRPGLTGLWQVSGRNSLGFREMLDLDAKYAAEGGPATDLQILAKTPITLVRRTAA